MFKVKENNHNFSDKVEVKDANGRISIIPRQDFEKAFEPYTRDLKLSDIDISVFFVSGYNGPVFYKKDLKNLHFVKLPSNYPRDLVMKSGKNFYTLGVLSETGEGIYVSEDDKSYFEDLVSKERKVLCFPHTQENGPYFFRVGDEYIESEYSNWFVFLYKTYGYLAEKELIVV